MTELAPTLLEGDIGRTYNANARDVDGRADVAKVNGNASGEIVKVKAGWADGAKIGTNSGSSGTTIGWHYEIRIREVDAGGCVTARARGGYLVSMSALRTINDFAYNRKKESI